MGSYITILLNILLYKRIRTSMEILIVEVFASTILCRNAANVFELKHSSLPKEYL